MASKSQESPDIARTAPMYDAELGAKSKVELAVAESWSAELVRTLGWRVAGDLVLYLYKHALIHGEGEKALWEAVEPKTGSVVLRGEALHCPAHVLDSLNELEQGGTKRRFERIMPSLVSVGLVAETPTSRLLVCPKCGSSYVGPRLYCPSCSSDEIKPTRLVQHVACGYVDVVDRFPVAPEGKRVCPRCNILVTNPETQLRVLGKLFLCESCNVTFKTPILKLICMNAETLAHRVNYEFDPLDGEVRVLKSYRLSSRQLSEPTLVEEVFAEALKRYVEERGLGLRLHAGKAIALSDEVHRIFKLTPFSMVIVNQVSKINVALDLGRGNDVTPYVMKTAYVSGTEGHYVLIITPQLEVGRTLMEEELAHSSKNNVLVLKLMDETFESLAEKITEFVLSAT